MAATVTTEGSAIETATEDALDHQIAVVTVEETVMRMPTLQAEATEIGNAKTGTQVAIAGAIENGTATEAHLAAMLGVMTTTVSIDGKEILMKTVDVGVATDARMPSRGRRAAAPHHRLLRSESQHLI